MPGAYPDLEALLPATYDGKPPAGVDSGRTCTTDALGTLATHGITGVRFAGATWSLGASSGLTVAVFDGTGLDPATMLEFYEEYADYRDNARMTRELIQEATLAARPYSQLLDEIIAAKALITCEACGRILYWEPPRDEGDPSAPPADDPNRKDDSGPDD